MFLTISLSKPKIAAIDDGFFTHAFCIAFALLATSFKPSVNEIYPAATNAENSPRECPATKSGLNDFSKTFASIVECKKIAGCVTLV